MRIVTQNNLTHNTCGIDGVLWIRTSSNCRSLRNWASERKPKIHWYIRDMLDSSALHGNILQPRWTRNLDYLLPPRRNVSHQEKRSKPVDTSVALLPKNIQASDLFRRYQESWKLHCADCTCNRTPFQKKSSGTCMETVLPLKSSKLLSDKNRSSLPILVLYTTVAPKHALHVHMF